MGSRPKELYRYLIRSKLDYRCIVYGSARKSYLQMLDPVQNQGLRLCLEAFRTSPVESLYSDAYEQNYICNMLPISSHCLNIPHMTRCLMTNICWVPSHVSIRGNEKADSGVNSALDQPRVKVGVPTLN